MSIETTREHPERGDDPDDRPPGYVVGSGPDDVERELSHDEFDPIGTLGIILVYFVILAVMWAFMYFVEFLGRGITVVG
ncbi:hypothetical protein [Halorussus amylolyticus]|uniref:hypothetical protein n=1 Tax=Halorussus amylolyticus TaxID=1126242 RepID=UPI00104A9AFA|nr:hypothetical protein [Halorussus amylolyticus]